MATSLVSTGVQFPDNSIQTTAASASGGSTAITTNTTLTSASTQIQVMTMTAWGNFVQFPNATTLTTGEAKFVLVNKSAEYPVGVLNGAGQVLGQVLPNDTTSFDLISNATSAGDWNAQGNLDPVWFSAKTLLNIRASGTSLAVAPYNSNTAILPYNNSSNQGCVRVLRLNGSSAVTVSPEIVVFSSAISPGDQFAVPVGANRALLRLDNTRVVLIEFSNINSPTVGAVGTITGMSSAEYLMPLDSQYAIMLGRNNSSYVLQAVCFDCGASGTTVTVGTTVNSAGFPGAAPIFFGAPVPVGTTAYGVHAFIFGGGGYIEFNAFTVTRTSGTTLSFSSGAGNPPGILTSGYSQNTDSYYDLGGGRRFWWYAGSTFANFMVITFTAGATPTYGSIVTSTQQGTTKFLASNPNRDVFLFTAYSSSTNYYLEALTVSGTTITKGTAQQYSTTNLSNSPQTRFIVQNNMCGAITWSDSVPGNNRVNQFRTFSISGTTITFGAEMQSPTQIGFPGFGFVGNLSFSIFSSALGATNGGNTSVVQTGEVDAQSIPQYRYRLFTVNTDRSITFLSDVYTTTSNNTEMRLMTGNNNQVVMNSSHFRPGSGLRPFNTVMTPSTGKQKTGNTIVGSYRNDVVSTRSVDLGTNSSLNLTRSFYNIGVIPGDINVGASVEIFTYTIAEA